VLSVAPGGSTLVLLDALFSNGNMTRGIEDSNRNFRLADDDVIDCFIGGSPPVSVEVLNLSLDV